MSAALAKTRPAQIKSGPRAEWQHVRTLVLAALPNAVNCARLLVHSALSSWQLDQHCIQAAGRIMDVLVAHAVATTGVTEAQPLYRQAFTQLTVLHVRMRLLPQSLVIEVWDCGHGQPEARLSQSLSKQQWGYELPARGQRVVWCAVPIFRQLHQDSPAGLPKPTPRPTPGSGEQWGEPVDALHEPNRLQHVRDGLRRLDRSTEQEDSC